MQMLGRKSDAGKGEKAVSSDEDKEEIPF